MSLDKVYNNISNRADKFLETDNWKMKVVIWSILLFLLTQLIFAPGSYLFHIHFFKSYVFNNQEYDNFWILNDRTKNLFEIFKIKKFDTFSHEHKLTYRLFLPIIAKLSPFRFVGPFILAVQIVFGVLYTYLVCNFVFKITENKSITFFFVSIFTSIYAGNAYLWDVVGYGDFFAYFFLFLSIYNKNAALIFVSLTLAFWVDERAVVNASFVYCWWLIYDNNTELKDKFFNVKYLLVIFLAILTYFLLRIFLTKYFALPNGQQYGGEFISTIYENIKYQGFRYWTSFEGFIGMIMLVFFVLFQSKKYKILLLLVLASFACITVSFFAHDGNRGFSYSVVLLFICLYLANHFFTKKELLYLMISIFLISLVFPMANRLRFPGGYTIM